MRALLSALVLLAVAPASAQSGPSPAVVVLQHTDTGGLDVLAPDAPRSPGSDAAVVTWVDGGWSLQTLGEGESVADIRPGRSRPVPPVRPTRPVRVVEMARHLSRLNASLQRDDRPVAFSVTLDVQTLAGATEAVAALAEVLDQGDALVELSIQTPTAIRSTISADFAFESVGAWTEWSQRSAAWQRLRALSGDTLQTHLNVRR